LLSPGFLVVNALLAVVACIASLFFSFSGYLEYIGIHKAEAGFIISADALAALIVQPLISPFVNTKNLRYWITFGALCFSAALLILSEATSVRILTIARLLHGSGFVCILSAMMAAVVSYIPPEMSGRAFGWISLVRLVPYAAVPPVYDAFSHGISSFASIIKYASAAALLPLIMIFLPVNETASDKGHTNKNSGFSGMFKTISSPPVALLLASSTLLYIVYSVVFFYLKQFGKENGIPDITIFFTVSTGFMIAVRLIGGYLFDRFSKVVLCASGLALSGISCAMIPYSSASHIFLYASAVLAGTGWGIAMPLQSALMFDVSEPESRALTQNLLIAMMQAGFFAGPLAAGIIISYSGFSILFTVMCLISLLSAAAAGCLSLFIPFCIQDDTRTAERKP
jgi:predicted MFS family arabinose efflux permease